jgi:hypothetical protein
MEEIEFNYQDVNLDTLFTMREELEKELETYDDDDIEDLKKAIELINTMCYYKIKKEQEEKEKLLVEKIEEIKLSKL